MDIERRALYNMMRMNWLHDPTIPAEAWQVDDYRSLTLQKLFERLHAHGLQLDEASFAAHADECESPEDLAMQLLSHQEEEDEPDEITQDKVYLLVFELWRRLLPEKPCLSVFCDELDHQIHIYDASHGNLEAIQDAIANLQAVLDENADQGNDPKEVFQSIASGCANDLESFLYDYISELIQQDQLLYASELLEGFSDYIEERKWFEFLKARLLLHTDIEAADALISRLVHEAKDEPDLDFNFELLAYLAEGEDLHSFRELVQASLALIEKEEDFQELLSSCINFYQQNDRPDKEKTLQRLLQKRAHFHIEGLVSPSDPQIKELLQILA